jgi:hypothetical protein
MLVVFDVSRLVWPLDGASTLLDIGGRNLIITILVAVLAKALDHERRMTWRRALLGFPGHVRAAGRGRFPLSSHPTAMKGRQRHIRTAHTSRRRTHRARGRSLSAHEPMAIYVL